MLIPSALSDSSLLIIVTTDLFPAKLPSSSIVPMELVASDAVCPTPIPTPLSSDVAVTDESPAILTNPTKLAPPSALPPPIPAPYCAEVAETFALPPITIFSTVELLFAAEIPVPIPAPLVELATIVPLSIMILPASPYLPAPIPAPSSDVAVNAPQFKLISPTLPL